MRKLLNKPWFTGPVALAAVVLCAYSLWPEGSSRKRTEPEPAAAVAATERTVLAGGAPRLSINEALKTLILPNMSRDAFAPRVRADTSGEKKKPDILESVHLSAIWTQEDSTLVLLNGAIHQVGDEIGRIKIESADQEGVWVSHWKGRDFIALGSDYTLKTPANRAQTGAPL